MSVPTHNLYDFVYQVTENKYCLLYFYPFGFKDLKNIVVYNYNKSKTKEQFNKEKQIQNNYIVENIFPTKFKNNINLLSFQPVLMCHDQEPLNFDLYKDNNISPELKQQHLQDYGIDFKNLNLRYALPLSYQKKWILLHSEVNSNELKKYEDTNMFIGAYWWSNAIIARDWYRFAEIDNELQRNAEFKKLFLIYSREASGSRTYRTEFLKLINNNNIDYQLGSYSSEEYIDSNSSATYDSYDFSNSGISVVLETVADSRIHLTEKTLRSIACGHPFILVAGPNSLEYLKGYGFKTFSPWINEDYDKETDLSLRMKLVADEMLRLSKLSFNEQTEILDNCNSIAQYNKKLFFSTEFYNVVVDELKQNVDYAFKQTCFDLNWKIMWADRKGQKITKPPFYKTERWHTQRPYMLHLIKHIKKGGTLEDYVPPDLD